MRCAQSVTVRESALASQRAAVEQARAYVDAERTALTSQHADLIVRVW
jgi:hypothetical protein